MNTLSLIPLEYVLNVFRQHPHVHKGVLDALADDIFTRIMELNKKITDMLDEHKDILYFKALFGL